MVVGPIGSYFLTLNTIFGGSSSSDFEKTLGHEINP